NFPKFDVNPNTGEPEGTSRSKRVAVNTVFMQRDKPSLLKLQMVQTDKLRFGKRHLSALHSHMTRPEETPHRPCCPLCPWSRLSAALSQDRSCYDHPLNVARVLADRFHGMCC